MTQKMVNAIESKKQEARTVAQTVAGLNPGRSLLNFNQLKGRDYSLKTYRRRHAISDNDDATRAVPLEEFTNDFYADGFADKRGALIVTDFATGLIRLIEDNKLVEKLPQTPNEIKWEIESQLIELDRALILMNEDKAREISVKIRRLSNELVDSIHMKRAFALGIG